MAENSLLASFFPSGMNSLEGLKALMGFNRGPTFNFGSLGGLMQPQQGAASTPFAFGGGASLPYFSLSPINRPPVQLSQPVAPLPVSVAPVAPVVKKPVVPAKDFRGGDRGGRSSGDSGGDRGPGHGPGQGSGSDSYGGPR